MHLNGLHGEGRFRAAVLCLFLLAFGLFQSAAHAQQPGDLQAVRVRLDAVQLELNQIETGLERPNLTDDALQNQRQRLDPLGVTLRGVVDVVAPRVDTAKSRLEQLGPKPDEKTAPESPELAHEREDRETDLRQSDETLRLARAMTVQIDQLSTTIGDRRRALFARALLTRSTSLVSPNLWMAVARAAPRDFSALATILRDWTSSVVDGLTQGRAVPVGLAAVAAIGVWIARRQLKPRFSARSAAIAAPTRLRKVIVAVGRVVLGFGSIALVCFLLFSALMSAGLLPYRIQPVAAAVFSGIALVAFFRSLGDAVLAPSLPQWRLIPVPDAGARILLSMIGSAAGFIAASKVVEAGLQAIAAALPISVASKALFSIAFALTIGIALHHLGNRESAAERTEDEDCLGPYVPPQPTLGGPLRVLAWAVITVIGLAAIVGYVSLAAFLVDQVAWIAGIACVLTVGLMFADESIAVALNKTSRFSLMLQSSVGLKRRAIDQGAVLIGGLVRLIFIAVALILMLAPWGVEVESADILSSVRAAFFGFKVGEITVSFSAIAAAVAFFAIGMVATRGVQGWLDRKFLPATDLDAGLRNSIGTGVGYLGFIAAAAVAFSSLGLSLDKLTIVAGALSVGIGFGLQSIVNNFVSGLIILWERAVRVGDWVVVGEGEGYVRRINVRSTEIETFERSTVIVPNANLVSGVVKNRMRGDPRSRVLISISVPRDTDPQMMTDLLGGAAREHPLVLEDPPVKVFFKKIGDATLEFDLMAFVPDVQQTNRVNSDLNLEIYKRLRNMKIIVPAGPPEVKVLGLEGLESRFGTLAEAIDRREPAGARA